MTATFIVGDTREVVASLPDGSVDLVLTSPPFLALRSYLPADHPDKDREPVGALGDKFRPATSDLVVAAVAADRWFDLDAVRTASDYKREPAARATAPGQKPKGCLDTVNPAGAPPLDWWEIVPKGFDGAHYATFPAELCIRPIEAMCPRRVCRTCGKPSRRETVTEYDTQGRTTNGPKAVGLRGEGSTTAAVRAVAGVATTGWSSCGCPGTDGIQLDGYHTGPGWRPGIVLDPFAGTGTTLQVAHGHGRDAIGIDLDDRNADLALGRLGMFLDVRHHTPTKGAA